MPDYSYQGKMSLWPYDPRYSPIAPPTVGIFDEPQMSICFNVEWAGHIDGVLSRLLWTDAWEGTPETKEWAVLQITALLASMLSRTPCGGSMDCCDEILARLAAIEAAIAIKLTPGQTKDTVSEMSDQYTEYIDGIDAIYDDNITNVHPDMAYGDDDDPIRDQALCFICQRFVDICCDWVIQNINLKVANQQTVLNIAALVGAGSDLLGRIFAETAFGDMFSNIDLVLDLEIAAATEWITSVTAEQLSIYQDTAARKAVACGWYEALKGATPTLSLFLSSLEGLSLTGNASVIQAKLLAALTPVDVPQQPNGERLYFIWSDLWQEAYDGAQAGIVPDCLCETGWCVFMDFETTDGSEFGVTPDIDIPGISFTGFVHSPGVGLITSGTTDGDRTFGQINFAEPALIASATMTWDYVGTPTSGHVYLDHDFGLAHTGESPLTTLTNEYSEPLSNLIFGGDKPGADTTDYIKIKTLMLSGTGTIPPELGTSNC